MKLKLIKLLLIPFLILSHFFASAQKSKTTAVSRKQYPASFKINKEDFDRLLTSKANDEIKNKNNAFIHQSKVLMNVVNGDTRFVKIQLTYFKKSVLTIQVNGTYSTQVFVLSDDNSVFYKGKLNDGQVIMTKCNKDDIVSE